MLCFRSGHLIVGAAGGIVGTLFGGYMQGKKLKKKYDKEKKDLIQYIQLQEEIYKQREQQWQSEYQKLYKAYDSLEKETLERDYEEFKAPDTNNDDMISRAEFNTYVRKYLSSFPELSEKDFPKFEEFDLDRYIVHLISRLSPSSPLSIFVEPKIAAIPRTTRYHHHLDQILQI